MNSIFCSPEMRLNIISIDLSIMSYEGSQGGLFASVLPQGVFYFTILDKKVQKSASLPL